MRSVFLSTQAGVSARRHAVGAVASAMALVPAAALAEAPVALDGVTVTAGASEPARNALTKLPAALDDIPQSVTVIDRTLLQAQGAASLADALKNVPGITLGGAEGGQIGNNINLNGFTARTDIFLDGFRDRGQYYRDTFALDQVEVLMGPSSMLFGRGSTGGAINQVSRTPKPRPSAEFDLSTTSLGLTRGVADLNAPLSDRSALRLSVMGQEGSASTRRRTTVDDYGAAPAYAWGLNTDTEIDLKALVQHNNDRPDYGVPPLNGAPAQSGPDTVYGYAGDRTIQDIAALSASVKHRLAGGVLLRDQLQFNGVDTDARETAPNAVGVVGAQGFAALTPSAVSTLPLGQLWVRLQSHDRVIRDTSLFDQAEAGGDWTTGPVRHALLAGAEIGHDHYANQAYYRNGGCGVVALNPAGGTSGYVGCEPLLNPPDAVSLASAPSLPGNRAGGEADTAALYVSDTATVLPQLKLVGGLRYDRYAASISNSINAANTPGNTTLAKADQTVFFTSVRGGAIWQPTQAQSYYLSYSTSFDPSLEQLTSTTGVTQPLPPEDNVAYEAGSKWSPLGDRLDLTAAAFQITQSNSRSQNPDNSYTANGTIRVRGARAGMSGRPTRGWQVFGGYTRLDASIIQAVAPGTQGRVPANTARDSATLWTTVDLPNHLQIGGGAIHMGRRWLNNTDTVAVPGYTRLDATLAWRRARYEVRLNVFNLADARYYDNLIPSDGGRAVPGSGRTAMLSLVWRP